MPWILHSYSQNAVQLIRRGNGPYGRGCERLAESLVINEVEELVLHNRSAEGGAELIALESRLVKRILGASDGIDRNWFDIAKRVQVGVANELVEGGVELIAAGLGGDVDQGAEERPNSAL
jgi:hypothetical protein